MKIIRKRNSQFIKDTHDFAMKDNPKVVFVHAWPLHLLGTEAFDKSCMLHIFCDCSKEFLDVIWAVIVIIVRETIIALGFLGSCSMHSNALYHCTSDRAQLVGSGGLTPFAVLQFSTASCRNPLGMSKMCLKSCQLETVSQMADVSKQMDKNGKVSTPSSFGDDGGVVTSM